MRRCWWSVGILYFMVRRRLDVLIFKRIVLVGLCVIVIGLGSWGMIFGKIFVDGGV